jgi:lipoprotein-anchoring transpeptidase ErfK/SrfK
MIFRTSCAIAALLIGSAVQPAFAQRAVAQYQPQPPQAYPAAPAPQAYPPQRQLPPGDASEDAPFYDPPVYGRPIPPGTVRLAPGAEVPPQAIEAPPPGPQYGRVGPLPPADLQPPPAGYIYRDDIPPRGHDPRAVESPPPEPRGFEPAAAGSRPYVPGAPAGVAVAPGAGEPQDGVRPPLPIGPGEQGVTGAVRGDPRTHMAALPADIRPETGPVKALPQQFRRTLVEYRTKEPVGTIIIDTSNTYLYLVLGNGQAMRYGVGVGREGFTWAGAEKVTKMAEWPDWNPPPEMIERQPYLPRFMAGGEGNPLGARALYLGKTIYRIHGTNQPSTIGSFVSSGCIRLTNEDVVDLYTRVKVGTRVVVLPGRAPPTTAAATSIAPPGQGTAPPVSMSPPDAAPVETPRRFPPPPFLR